MVESSELVPLVNQVMSSQELVNCMRANARVSFHFTVSLFISIDCSISSINEDSSVISCSYVSIEFEL